jgi:hypothetical protein
MLDRPDCRPRAITPIGSAAPGHSTARSDHTRLTRSTGCIYVKVRNGCLALAQGWLRGAGGGPGVLAENSIRGRARHTIMQLRGPTCHGWRAPPYRPVRPFAAENRYAQRLNALALARAGSAPGVLDAPQCGSEPPAMTGVGPSSERISRGRGDAPDDYLDRLVAHAVGEGEVAQARVARPRGDLGPACRRELRTVLGRGCLLGRVWAVGQGAADGEAGRSIVRVRATGEFTHAYSTSVTSASPIRPVDAMAPGVIVFPRYSPLCRSGCPSPAPAAAPRPPKKRLLPQRTPRIAPANWPFIAARARHESLRDLAAAYGVNHETIRVILRRSGCLGHTAAALD